MSKHKYDHAEAFCLMDYGCEDCKKIERLWNSRDGVTPFIIGCPSCGGAMRHINWNNDLCNPDYVPESGQRVFIDMTKEIDRIYKSIRVERFWENKDYPMSHVFKNKHEALSKLCEDFREGEPFIIII